MIWPMVPLGDLCSPKQWPTLSKAQMSQAGHVVYGANGPIGFSENITHRVRTILIGCRGSCGSVHVIPAMSYANGNAMALDKLNERKVNLDYLALFLQARGFKDVVTGSSQPQIIRSNIVRIKVPLPPLNEQRRIAVILNKADALRRKRKRAMELLEGLTQSVFLEMFGDPLSNVLGMKTVFLQDIVSKDRKITYGILKPGPDIIDGVPYVRVLDIRNSRIDVTGLKRTSASIAKEYRRSTLSAGDLLISIRGHVGRMAIVPIECEGANITQDTARLAIERADTEFVKAQLETEAAQNWMARRTKGAAVKGINLGDLKLFPLMLPPVDEQLKFSQRISGLRRKAITAAHQSRKFDLFLASLQHRAFSSQL